MGWLKRLMWFSIAAGLLGLIGYAFVPEPPVVDVARVTRGPIVVSINEDGKTRIKDRYVVSAPLTGRLLRIKLKAGDPVIAGQTVVATLEPAPPELLDPRALAQAEARVRAAEATLKKTGASLAAARAALENAESEHGRARRLFANKNYTQQDLDSAALLERTKSEEFRAARFAEEIARFELELAQAALIRSLPPNEQMQAAQSTPDAHGTPWQLDIRSPITGRVLKVLQESAGVMTAGAALIELGNPNDLEAVVDVISTDAVKIRPGDKVIFEHWGGPHPLEGRVRLIEPAAFTKISALGVEEQRVNVIADFVGSPGERAALGDAYRVEARIVTWERTDVLRVPTGALFRHGNDWAVLALSEGRALMQPVQIGHQNALEAEVLKGLEENAQVVVHPNDKIRTGMQVAVR
jgi:HlyD family secretion protein